MSVVVAVNYFEKVDSDDYDDSKNDSFTKMMMVMMVMVMMIMMVVMMIMMVVMMMMMMVMRVCFFFCFFFLFFFDVVVFVVDYVDVDDDDDVDGGGDSDDDGDNDDGNIKYYFLERNKCFCVKITDVRMISTCIIDFIQQSRMSTPSMSRARPQELRPRPSLVYRESMDLPNASIKFDEYVSVFMIVCCIGQ